MLKFPVNSFLNLIFIYLFIYYRRMLARTEATIDSISGIRNHSTRRHAAAELKRAVHENSTRTVISLLQWNTAHRRSQVQILLEATLR